MALLGISHFALQRLQMDMPNAPTQLASEWGVQGIGAKGAKGGEIVPLQKTSIMV